MPFLCQLCDKDNIKLRHSSQFYVSVKIIPLKYKDFIFWYCFCFNDITRC